MTYPPYTIDLWLVDPDISQDDEDCFVSMDFKSHDEALDAFKRPRKYFKHSDITFAQYVAYDWDEVCDKRRLKKPAPMSFFGRKS